MHKNDNIKLLKQIIYKIYLLNIELFIQYLLYYELWDSKILPI